MKAGHVTRTAHDFFVCDHSQLSPYKRDKLWPASSAQEQTTQGMWREKCSEGMCQHVNRERQFVAGQSDDAMPEMTSAKNVRGQDAKGRNDLRQDCARTTNQRRWVLVTTHRSLGHACGHSDGNPCRRSKRTCHSSSYDIVCDRGGTRRNTSCSSKVSS